MNIRIKMLLLVTVQCLLSLDTFADAGTAWGCVQLLKSDNSKNYYTSTLIGGYVLKKDVALAAVEHYYRAMFQIEKLENNKLTKFDFCTQELQSLPIKEQAIITKYYTGSSTSDCYDLLIETCSNNNIEFDLASKPPAIKNADLTSLGKVSAELINSENTYISNLQVLNYFSPILRQILPAFTPNTIAGYMDNMLKEVPKMLAASQALVQKLGQDAEAVPIGELAEYFDAVQPTYRAYFSQYQQFSPNIKNYADAQLLFLRKINPILATPVQRVARYNTLLKSMRDALIDPRMKIIQETLDKSDKFVRAVQEP